MDKIKGVGWTYQGKQRRIDHRKKWGTEKRMSLFIVEVLYFYEGNPAKCSPTSLTTVQSFIVVPKTYTLVFV